MKRKMKYIWLAAAVLAVALLISGTAFAEGEEPPEAPAAPAETVPAESASPPEEQPAAEAPADEPAAEVPAGDDGSVIWEDDESGGATAEEAPAAPADESAAMPAEEAAAPENPPAEAAPDVTIVDGSGQPVDLASQDSGDLLTAGDPRWVAGGTTYSSVSHVSPCYPGTTVAGGTCFVSATPIQTAINQIATYAALIPDDGKITVEYGGYGDIVTIDGSLYPNLQSLSSLVGETNSSGAYPVLTRTLTISGLTNGFFLNGFTISGGVTVTDSSGEFSFLWVTAPLTMTNINVGGADGTSINVSHHSGNITLTNVTAKNNSGASGAWIDNMRGGSVTINGSTFSGNDQDGVNITSAGLVTLNGLTANGNDATGINVGYCTALSIKNTTANDNTTGWGIYATPYNRAVTLETITANGNGQSGIYLYDVGNVVAKNITANQNDWDGVYIQANSAVNLTNVVANGNVNNRGVSVYADRGLVTVNNLVANDNGDLGLFIEGRGVTIRNLITRGNGAGMYAYLWGGAAYLENVSAIDNQYGSGVWVNSIPDIVVPVTMRNVIASGNAGGGIGVEVLGNVMLTNTITDNNSGGDGVYIATRGAVTLNTLWSSGNGGNGLEVEGIYVYAWSDAADDFVRASMQSPLQVTLTSATDPNFTNFFSSNGRLYDWDIGMNGVHIISQRPVVIYNFGAYDNPGYGVLVDGPVLQDPATGDYLDNYSGPVTLAATVPIPGWRNSVGHNGMGVGVFSASAVTLIGLRSDANEYHAVDIYAKGAITLRDVHDWGNGESKTVWLDNSDAAGYLPVTITNLEIFETQGGWGAALGVHSKGAITITNLTLVNNNSLGADLKNNGLGRGNVTLTNAEIQGNRLGGIKALSNGAILLTNAGVNWNGWSVGTDEYPLLLNRGGAYLQNNDLLVVPVTLTDCEFNGNNGTGLQVFSKGAITLRGVHVNQNNILYGSIENEQTVYELNHIDWKGADEWRFYYGDSFNFDEEVKINLRAYWGFEPVVELYQVNIDGSYSLVAADDEDYTDGVFTSTFNSGTLSQYKTYVIRVGYNDTVGYGDGGYLLSLNDPDENNRKVWADGAILDNSSGPGAGVVVTPTARHPYNVFSDNNGYGLNITSFGAIGLYNVHADGNTYKDGLRSDNPDSKGSVTVQCSNPSVESSFNNNGDSGLFVRTQGSILLYNVHASGNWGSGADLDNCIEDGGGACRGFGAINLVGLSGKPLEINDNQLFGVWALSKSAIAVTNISANRNGYDGVALLNNRSGSVMPVTVSASGITRNVFNENGWRLDEKPEIETQGYEVRWNGLTIMSGGNVSVLNSTANDNRDWGGGIVIRNHGVSVPRTVLLVNNEASNNGWAGVFAMSKGNITLTNINANDNAWSGWMGGVNLDNCLWDEVSSTCQGSGLITLTNINASNNGGSGIQAYSKGFVTLRGAQASDNGHDGVDLQNSRPGTLAGMTVVNVSANNNNATGINLHTNGALTLSSLAANNNVKRYGGFGIDHDTDMGHTVQDYYNKSAGADQWWFDAKSETTYTVKLMADGKGWEGVWLNRADFDPYIELWLFDHEDPDNPTQLDIASLGSYGCVLNVYCEFSFEPKANFSLDYEGTQSFYLMVRNGASGDGFYRLSINDPTPVEDEIHKYWANGMSFAAGGNVVLSGYNSFSNNSLAGVNGWSGGSITAYNVGAFNNGAEGLNFINENGNFTLAGNNVAMSNGWEGLRVETQGAVNIMNLSASYNNHRDWETDERAAVRINSQPSDPKLIRTVTLTNLTLLNNSGEGLFVKANGLTTLNYVRAWLNGFGGGTHSGAYVDAGGFEVRVMNSSFMCNQNHGLSMQGYIVPTFKFTNINNIFLGNGNNPYHIY